MSIVALLILGSALRGADLRTYETRYYTLYTDVDPDSAREASLRMTRMAEEYANRTRDFAGAIRQKMPFYLYQNPEDYYATGAPRTTAGYFNGEALVASAGKMDGRTWHIVQHEGFHQFARAVIGGQMPPWVNEGMAEYFGEALFTGDSFISGVIPPWRLKRVRETLSAGKFMTLDDMMNLSLEQWNADIQHGNYDQAWMMAQFLAHGESGKYQRAFGQFMTLVGRSESWPLAWGQTFGDTKGFEQRWREYWLNLPDDPTVDLYARANVATLTSYLARAVAQKQSFENFGAFMDAATKRQLKSHTEDWLPPRLLVDHLELTKQFMKEGYSYELATRAGEKLPTIRCTMADGRVVVGKFSLRGDRAGTVTAEIAKPRAP